MVAKLLGVFDNGRDSTIRGVCADCGASLRYEYLTSDGIYGSECVNAHIHRPDWMTLKAKYDSQKWIGIQNILSMLEKEFGNRQSIRYIWYQDGSVGIEGGAYPNAIARKMFIYGLIDSGWQKSKPEPWMFPGSYRYTLTRPIDDEK